MIEVRYAKSGVWKRVGRSDLPSGVTSTKYPSPFNTGVPYGTSLLKVPDDATAGPGWKWNGFAIVATGPGVTISGLDIQPGFDVAGHSNITLKNSLIRGIGVGDFVVALGKGCTLMDCEIGGGADGVTYLQDSSGNAPTGVYTGGIEGQLNTILRCNIHHTGDGLRLDSGTTVRRTVIHSLNCGQTPGVHSDASQQTQGSAPVEFDNCSIQGGVNDGIFLEVGDSTYYIHDSLIQGDTGPAGSTSFGVGGKTTSPPFGTITIENNTFILDDRIGQAIGHFPVGQVVVRSGNVDQYGVPLPGEA